MTIRHRVTALLPRRNDTPITARAWMAFESRVRALHGQDRGDVPGWVLVTLMTAGIVAVLGVLAKDQLQDVFKQAMSTVKP
ncbi:hypothetical protein IC607_13320 [Cellulomonas sp. JH27-2]|uniref:hypothetical protein n=1 Tax=Cellulomonas sp. JH27-2 TaxID=2774139 RepID=UPI0017836126|nr:hypothetical protein [Cellulomonas sp. JH27-2]MBD8059949.1 hypothetical protein [Cellulomonas sp. JH27-2]